MKREQTIGWGILALLGLFLAWLLTKGKSVLGASTIQTATGLLQQLDPITGAPQYDSRQAGSTPGGYVGPPTAANGGNDPMNGAVCPLGTLLWKDVATGSFGCFQQGPPGITTGPQQAAGVTTGPTASQAGYSAQQGAFALSQAGETPAQIADTLTKEGFTNSEITAALAVLESTQGTLPTNTLSTAYSSNVAALQPDSTVQPPAVYDPFAQTTIF